MPKEVTHWLIAHQVATSLQGTPAGEAAEAFPNCLLLGAILHDAPYYARGRSCREMMKVIADAIHGKGHDVFALIENVAAMTVKTDNAGPELALLVGMISHIAADSCFHPLIYHETGNYDDPDPVRRTRAVQLHRRFETILDVYLAGTMTNIKTFSLKKIISGCERPVPALLLGAFMQTAEDFDFPKLPEGILNGLRNFARMQSLYSNPLITRILQTLYPCLPAGMREIASLFYLPRFIRMAPELHGEWTMPDPETGSQRSTTIRELYSNSVQLSIELCQKMVPIYGALPAAAPRPHVNPEDYALNLQSEPEEPDNA
jgi:hypothetical protein